MSTADILAAIGGSALAQAVAKSDHLVGAALQIVHVLGFVLLLAALVLVSLRLLGWAFAGQPAADVVTGPLRLLWAGLGAAVLSGALMFIASPALYFHKQVFLFKLGLLLAALPVLGLLARRAVRQQGPAGAGGRAVVALALLACFGVGAAGRAIGFV